MPIEVLMPALSPTMEEGTLAQMAGQGGRPRGARRRHRRDRDRQGDHGGRGRRRRQDRSAGSRSRKAAEGVQGQHGHRLAAWKRARRRRRIGAASAHDEPAPGRRAEPAAAPETAADSDAAAHAPAASAAVRPRNRRGGLCGRDEGGHRPRGPARRHGRGDAPRRAGLPDGRGGCRVSGRLQGEPGPARRVRRRAGDRHADHRARLRRPRHRRGLLPGCARSSSS